MNIINKSRKQKKYNTRVNNYTKKLKGGEEPLATSQINPTNTANQLNQANTANPSNLVDPGVAKVDEQVREENKLVNFLGLGNSPLFQKSKLLAEGIAVNTLNGVGEFAGVNLEDPASVQEKLDGMKRTLTDPETTKKMVELGVIALEATAPFTQPLIDKTVEAGGEAISKMGEAGVKVLLNTAEEIPGVGIILGTVRSLDNVGEAIISSVNAGTEVITTASNTINATAKNFKRLIKEKEDILNRTQQSVNNFRQAGGALNWAKGGTRKSGLKRYKKTKKSRK